MATPKKSQSYLAKLYRSGVRTGKPPKYKTPRELSLKIQAYFDSITDYSVTRTTDNTLGEKGGILTSTVEEKENVSHSTGEPCPTLTGLALFCGFASRQTFYDLEKVSPGFSYVVRGARTIVERYHEIRVSTRDKASGSVFILQNMGWTSKLEINNTGDKAPRQIFKIGDAEIVFE